jgi:RNA polymerase sigma-54 factor
MKASLQLNLSQQLTLTPQLQQAIRLLQLSTLDLNQEIQQALESNPMLELQDSEHNITVVKKNDISRESYREQNKFTEETTHYASTPAKGKKPSSDDFNFEHFYGTTTSLSDHLYWQLNLTPMTELDKAIAVTIIDAISLDGMLNMPLNELHESVLLDLSVSIEEIESVRNLILRLDPVGCGASSLAESLSVQLGQLEEPHPSQALALKLVHNHLSDLGHKNYRLLMKELGIDEQTLSEAIQLIQTLNPKPGHTIESERPEYIIPDIVVKKINDQWVVSLNQESLPKLSINDTYASMIRRADNSNDNQYLKNNLQEARWLLKSIESRQDTLFRVAKSIVMHQVGFFEAGHEAMKPLILNDIAELLGMHESTISRVTTQKYMHTPKGIYELKYFFSSHVTTNNGGECSSTAIRAVIKKLIAEENPRKPLSDNKISVILNEQGVSIARRTVAKYRESLGIASSNERKSIIS